MRIFVVIIVGLLCTLALHVRANDPISSQEYVLPQPGLLKLYYCTVAADRERRGYTDVSIMDVTSQGITGTTAMASAKETGRFNDC